MKTDLTNASATVWRFYVREKFSGRLVSRHRTERGANYKLRALVRRHGEEWVVVPSPTLRMCPHCGGTGVVVTEGGKREA